MHVTHPHLYKCLQVHVIANARLVRYERDSCKRKMLTRNVATYATIPITQRAGAADEQLMHTLARWQNSEPCLNRTPRRNTTG